MALFEANNKFLILDGGMGTTLQSMDLPLTLQPALCAALDSQRRLGVTVTESLLMVPMKTVSAVIGLADTPQPARIRGCAFCARRETCTFRKGGTTCGLSE